jgi:hypothetical protein
MDAYLYDKPKAKAAPVDADTLDMFSPSTGRPALSGLADHATSVAAGEALSDTFLSQLRGRVYRAIQQAGDDGLTDLELEKLPEFNKYAPSTVRKRRSELWQRMYINGNGKRDGATIWRLPVGAR